MHTDLSTSQRTSTVSQHCRDESRHPLYRAQRLSASRIARRCGHPRPLHEQADSLRLAGAVQHAYRVVGSLWKWCTTQRRRAEYLPTCAKTWSPPVSPRTPSSKVASMRCCRGCARRSGLGQRHIAQPPNRAKVLTQRENRRSRAKRVRLAGKAAASPVGRHHGLPPAHERGSPKAGEAGNVTQRQRTSGRLAPTRTCSYYS
jgi:hypothetical protein